MRRNVRQQKSRNKVKLLIFTVAAVIILGAGAFGIYKWKFASHSPTSSQQKEKPGSTVSNVNYDPPTQSEKDAGNQQKDQIINQQNNPPASGGSQQNPTNLSITIVRAGQIAGSSTVQIRTVVTGATSGSCTATLTQSGQTTVTQAGTIQVDATSADCGIDIPVGSFGASGTWQLSIVAKNGNATSPAATQAITITR